MKLLFLGPSNVVHMRRIVTSIALRGHDVHVVSMKPDPIPEATFERFEVPGFGLAYPKRWRGRWERRVAELLGEFDAVCVHFVTDWGITPDAVRDTPLIVRSYGSDIDPMPGADRPDSTANETKRDLLCLADRVVAPSRAFAATIRHWAPVDLTRLLVLHDAVDTNLFHPRARTNDSPPVVGYCKGFDPVYDPLTLIEAIPFVVDRVANVRFELLGDGVLRDACLRRADALGVQARIRWLDRRLHDQMPDAFANWDMLAVTSRKESFCVCAIEAAAMGIPVVATRVGGLPESVADGETGILVEPGNFRALADALTDVLSNAPRRRALGDAGRRRACAEFDWETHVDRWIELFEAAVCARGEPAAAFDR